MSAPPYMRLYWGDYHKATRHLTRDQHGAYFLLIGEAWRLGGSLPDDDRMLAAWALCTPEEWAGLKPAVMAFFALRRGKWVHDRVREELAHYEDVSRKRKSAGKQGGSASRGNSGEKPQANAPQKPTKPEPEPDGSSVPNGTGAEAPCSDEVITGLLDLPLNVRAWRLGRKVLIERGGKSSKAAGDLLAKLVNKDGLPVDDLWNIAEAAWRNGTDDPASYMAAAARETIDRMRGRSTTIAAPSEARQRAWMEDWRSAPATWRVHERGPRPGEQGCRVSPAIQRESGVTPFGEPPVEAGADVLPFPNPPERRTA